MSRRPAPERPLLGEYLRAAREDQGLMQLDVAQRGRFASPHISAIETGSIRNPRVDTFLDLVEAYGLPVTRVLYDVYGIECSETDRGIEETSRLGQQVMDLLPKADDRAKLLEIARIISDER